MKDKKFEIWRGDTMLGAVTVIDGVAELDSRAEGLNLDTDLTDWDRTAGGLYDIAVEALGEPITILTPWEEK